MSRENMLLPYANNKESDKSVHPYPSLFSAFVCYTDTISIIPSLYIFSVAEQASLSITGHSLQKAAFVAHLKPEDHWSCIAHLSAEDMLKSAVIEEKKFKHSPWPRVDNPLGPKVWCQQEGLITMVIYCKFKKNLFNLWLYKHLFMI